MAGGTRAAAHLSAEEVLRRWKQDPRTHRRQRWLIIYQALVDLREAEQIAKHCGVSLATVHQLLSAYNRRGVAAVETPGKGGRRTQYLTLEQEQQFLAPISPRRRLGRWPPRPKSNRRLKRRWATRWQKPRVLRLLDRHGWRKLVPRPVHPKANHEEPAAFKKTASNRFKPPSPRAAQTTSDRSS